MLAQASDPATAIRADLAQKPDGVLEELASRHGVPLRLVLDCLNEGQALAASGDRFEDVWADLTSWGEITFIVHTQDGVFEVKGTIPPGSAGRGYFNVHGDSPIGGHIRANRCAAIYFVDRPFFGRRSCSVQFVNQDGGVMFKVFVGRGPDRALDPAQVTRFEALRAAFCA